MGAFDWLSQSADWVKNRWNEDWKDFRDTFKRSWGSFVAQEDQAGNVEPGIFENVGAGLYGMVQAPFADDGDFWGSGRLWLDSMVQGGTSLLGGTLGTLFQVPILHEAAWLLDKAYRYGIARPIATPFIWVTGSQLEAYNQGKNSDADLLEQMFQWNSIRKAWNDSEYVTPGQAIAYSGGGLFQDMGDELHGYLERNDPRTKAGQARFNSPDADFWFKYTSGTLDFAGNVFADPAHGAAVATKAAKLRFVDKVADEKYVAAGKVELETQTSNYAKVRALALRAETPEQFRQQTMPQARNGGQMATLLWTAARMGDEIYKDTYLATRAFDAEAFARLADQAPKIAADYADMFANFTIADFDYQRGKLASDGASADALRQTTVDAFVDSFAGGEGIWGSAEGIGVLEKMPRASIFTKKGPEGERIAQPKISARLRMGYHSAVLNSRPIIIGKPVIGAVLNPLGKVVQRGMANLMPSQGWTPRIDPMDGTGIGLRQFRANLERTKYLTPEEINQWVSRYGAATSDAVRHTMAMRSENVVVTRMLKDMGLTGFDMARVLQEMNTWRSGARRLWGFERRYVSEEAARRAEKAVARGDMEKGVGLLRAAEDVKAAVANGEVLDEYVSMTDVDGRVNLIPINRSEPLLRSQFTDAIAMLDYRALQGALRWWKLTHPTPRALNMPDVKLELDDTGIAIPPAHVVKASVDGTAIPRGWKTAVEMWQDLRQNPEKYDSDVNTLENRKEQVNRAIQEAMERDAGTVKGVPLWQTALAQAARVRGFWDASIGVMDALSTLWKATALMRPAQAPRNVADDVLRTYIQFGKLPLLLAAANTVPNMWKNWVPSKGRTTRTQLAWEALQERIAKQNATGSARPTVDGEADINAPGNVDLRDKSRAADYMSYAAAYGDGAITFMQYFNLLNAQMGNLVTPGPKFGTPRPGDTKVEPIKFFTASQSAEISRALQEENMTPAMKAKAERRRAKAEAEAAAATSGKPPRPSERPGMNEMPYEPIYSGPPHLIERVRMQQYADGQITWDQLRRALTSSALKNGNRNKYQSRNWGNDLIKQIIDKHFKRRETADYLDDPYAPSTVIVDPFVGTTPTDLAKDLKGNFDITQMAVLQTRTIPKKKKGSPQSVALGTVAEQMRAFVDYYAEDLLEPGALLALRVKPNGNIAIGIARAKKEVLESGATVKAGALARLKNFHVEDINDIAHTGFEVRDKNGNKIMSFAGVLQGPMGQAMQHRVSARSNPSVAYGLLTDPDIDSLIGEQGSWTVPLTKDHKDYAVNWERAVNAQMASDPVARLFIEGRDDGYVIDQVQSTAWGTKWIRAMSFRGIAYVDQITQIKAMVDSYLPHPTDDSRPGIDPIAAQQLREAALQKKATFTGLESAMKDRDQMPEIHGLSVEHIMGNSRAWKFMRDQVRRAQKVISDMPVDKVARFPYMAMAYKQHGSVLARIANDQYKGAMPARVVNHVKELARERAYHDTRYRLYDTAQRNDFANATRFLMPFSAAMMDGYIKYGRAIRENPMLLVQGAYYWTMFERNAMVQDENGYVAEEENGRTVWYSVDPDTGDRTRVPDELVGREKYVQFQLPSSMAKLLGMETIDYYGVEGKTVLAVNKDTMNVFLNLPSAGPLVAFPANEFALDKPEFGEDEIIKKFILPFGPSSARGKVFLPSTVRSAWDKFMAEDGDTASGHAAAIMQAELIGVALGTRQEPPTFEEVREKAAAMKSLRFLATYVSPASFQMVSPYQAYVDAYRQLVQEDPTTAAEKFMQRYGDEFYAVTMSVSRNNAGITASLKSHENYLKYKEFVEEYPEFGGLIVGSEGAGEFAKSVYEAQKDTPLRPGSKETMRSLMSIGESVEQLQSKTVWARYSKMMDLITSAMVDRGITSLTSRAARDLAAQKNAFVEANKHWIDPATGEETLSPWYMDFMSSDRGAVEKKFEALRKIVSDPDLLQRDDIRGLAQYLAMRNDMKTVMSRYQYKSLSSQKARRLRQQWEDQVFDLVESNVAFKGLWNRWLSNDNTLDIG